jgi:hypothetical protein
VCNLHGAGASSCLFPDHRSALSWPLAAALTISVGGVTVTCEDAERACELLESSGTCAIRQVLAARKNPLASCDYHAVYAPGVESARAVLAATGRPGGAGRHLAKHAFCAAVRGEVTRAACRALHGALAAIAGDERYAVAIARDAVALAARRGLPRGAVLVSDCDYASCTDAIAA